VIASAGGGRHCTSKSFPFCQIVAVLSPSS
jgi:hypothetical protein